MLFDQVVVELFSCLFASVHKMLKWTKSCLKCWPKKANLQKNKLAPQTGCQWGLVKDFTKTFFSKAF